MDVMKVEAGEELDALVGEKVLGISYVPPLDYAKAKVGWRHIASTGPVFAVRIGDERLEIPVPQGDTLRQPEGSDYWNDRYTLYIAEQLGDRIADEVAAYRMKAQPYSTDPTAALALLETFGGGYCVTKEWMTEERQNMEYVVEVYPDRGQIESGMCLGIGRADTFPLAAARAALAAKEQQP